MMKTTISLIIMILTMATGVLAATSNDLDFISSQSRYLEVFENGKMTPLKIIASFYLDNRKGDNKVKWQHIYITPFDKQRDVNLKIESFSTEDGTINNVKRNRDNTLTFTLDPGIVFSDPKSVRLINVWCKVSNSGEIESVRASMKYYSNIVKASFVTTWQESKEPYFDLPYKRVF
jgi:hypothetical protein